MQVRRDGEDGALGLQGGREARAFGHPARRDRFASDGALPSSLTPSPNSNPNPIANPEQARSDAASAHHDSSLVNEFLAAWDGIASEGGRVLVVGTTNRPDRLDEAVLRRMPRRLLIDLPKEEEREQILRALLAGEQLDTGVDVAGIAAATPGYSGSDLKNLCIKAALLPRHQPRHQHQPSPPP